MTVPVFVLPVTTSNMYFVHVDLMNRGLYLLCQGLELSGHLSITVDINTKLVLANKHLCVSYLTIFSISYSVLF